MPPPETTKLEIPEWTGSGLSNGDHLAYAKDLYNIYSKGDYTPLSLEEIGQLLTPALESLNAAVNRQRAFDETSDVTAADATRDRIFYALWSAWDYLSQLDPHHPFYVAANTLRSEMMKCKGAARWSRRPKPSTAFSTRSRTWGTTPRWRLSASTRSPPRCGRRTRP